MTLKGKSSVAQFLVGILTIVSCSTAYASVEAGKEIVMKGANGKTPPCMACHQANGYGNLEVGYPVLAGMPKGYIIEQLKSFASGARHQSLMQPIASQLSSKEMEDVADYFSSLPHKFDLQKQANLVITYPPVDDKIAWLVFRGDYSRDIPACITCHGPGAVGVGQVFPTLAGQSAKYITEQLNAWREGNRPKDPHDLMVEIAKRLTPDEATALGKFMQDKIIGYSAQGKKGE